MKRLFLASACVLASACNNSSGLVFSDEPAGANCPAGGVKIEESGKTRYVCNGANGTSGSTGANGSNGVASLVKQTPLAVGDAQCPGGGVRVDTGLDSGGDGGVANDGTLEPGEVTQTTFVCANDTSAKVGSMQVPPGAAGTSVIDASGGSGDAGAGGLGGSIQLHLERGTNGGHLATFKTGHVDATFTAPAALPGDLGPVPATVTADTAVVAYDTAAPGAAVDAGTLFLFGWRFYVASGTAAPGTIVTGLSVAAGATLKLPSQLPNDQSPVELERSCKNAGTIAVAPGTNTHFLLRCGDFQGAAGSRIDVSGPGGDANDAGVGGGAFSLATAGALQNLGTVVATGGAGHPGGAGGTIRLMSDTSRVFNAGPLTATGGAGLGGATGGLGGSVFLTASVDLLNSGAIDASGGSGLSGGGGGQLILTSFVGSLHNTGALAANGGSADAACQAGRPCSGGVGGRVDVRTAQGLLANDAAVSAKGGRSMSNVGGGGGQVTFEEVSGVSSRFGYSIAPAQSVLLSGSVDVSGGSGAAGGAGGTVSARLDWGTIANGAELRLLGYAAFLVRGGAGIPAAQGTTCGGGGGFIEGSQQPGALVDISAEAAGKPLPAGATLNTVDLFATGGSCPIGGTSGIAGNGGQVFLRTQHDAFFSNAPWEVLMNAGAVDVSGGSADTAGRGGTVAFYGRAGLTSTGTLAGNGGAGRALGGAAGSVGLGSDDGAVSHSGATTVQGGASAGPGTGGEGGQFGLQGVLATLAATVDASGGGGDATSGKGGKGGTVDCSARAAPVSVTVAAPAGLSVAGGAASKKGAPGFVVLDGAQVTSAWTH